MKKTAKPHPADLPADIYEAYKKEMQNGIITVGNACNAECFFCCQKWNPPCVVKNLDRLLTLEEIKHFVSSYSPGVQMVGGCAHVNPGEFFAHPQALEIMHFLRRTNKLPPRTCLFTNGINLNKNHLKTIKKFDLRVFLSFNPGGAEAKEAKTAMTGPAEKKVMRAVELMERYTVPYEIYTVPFRSCLNNGRLEQTFRLFRGLRAACALNLHRTGYTKCTPRPIRKELAITDREQLEFIDMMRKKHGLTIRPQGTLMPLQKAEALLQLTAALARTKQHFKKNTLFLCSEYAYGLVNLALNRVGAGKYRLAVVGSGVFGGNIDCAGLLLVEDYSRAIGDILRSGDKPGLVVLPRRSFDVNMEDISMVPASELGRRFGLKMLFV